MHEMKEKVGAILKNVFGELEYHNIKSFFERMVNNDDIEILILTTRRCHVLFSLFKKYIFSDEEIIAAERKTLITDKAIHYYAEEIKDKVCLLADDMLIHGRALNDISDRLANKKPKELQRFVYAKSDFAHINVKSKIEEGLCNREWKKLSNEIIAAITLTSLPYTSYVFSYSKEMNAQEFISFKENLKDKFPVWRELEIDLQEVDNNFELSELIRNNIEAYIFEVFSKNRGYSCIRLYYNKYLNKCIVLPFHFMEYQTENSIDRLCEANFSNFDELFFTTNDYCVKYRAVTAYYSLCVLKDNGMEEILSSSNGWENNKEEICMSYYNDFYVNVLDAVNNGTKDVYMHAESTLLTSENYITNYKEYKNDDVIRHPLHDDIYYCEFKKFLKEDFGDSSYEKFSKYFDNLLRNIHEKEEDWYFENEKNNKFIKQEGLSLDIARSEIEKKYNVMLNNYSLRRIDYYTKLVSALDSGLLTLFPDAYEITYKGKNSIKLYSNFLITGEQVCRLFQDKYIIFIYQLNIIYNGFNKIFKLSMSFYDYVCKCLDVYLSDSPEICGKVLAACRTLEEIGFANNFVNNIYENVNDKRLEEILEKGDLVLLYYGKQNEGI